MPIKTSCDNCGILLIRSPSKIEPRNYCSLQCYSKVRNKELAQKGKPYQITRETSAQLNPKRVKALIEKTKGSKHYAWKGEEVSYFGLHMWLNREKGKASKHRCHHCEREASDWASIDGTYPRDVNHFIPLCKSCHKIMDLAIKSIRGAPAATR